MIHSMTGFGEAERKVDGGLLRLSVKTVNHRFFHSSIRLPTGNEALEPPLTERLRGKIKRGHATCTLLFEREDAATTDARLPVVDLQRAQAYVDALELVGAELEVPGVVDLALISRFSELFRPSEGARGVRRFDPALVVEMADEALAGVTAMRRREGERLQEDLEERLSVIVRMVDRIEVRAPERLVSERDRLREAVVLLTGEVATDEDRLAREIAYLAERWDINEEIVRLRSHVELFRESVRGAADRPAGKRLGFIIQEMNREANTVGSKANDAEISRSAVGIKEEIERLREQVENIE